MTYMGGCHDIGVHDIYQNRHDIPPWHMICHGGMSCEYFTTLKTGSYMSWQYTHGVMHVCHGNMSWRVYVMAVCHGSSEGFYMSCGMSWHVMSWRYVMHVSQVSCMYHRCHACTRYVIECVMQGCHVGMSWWYVIAFSGMSYRYVMAIYDVVAICHWDVIGMSGMSCKYVMGICHEHMSCIYQRCHVSTRYVIKVCHA